jgi:hypothetical protein
VAAALALASAAPLPAMAVTHPESTRMDRPATAAERVRIRVLDKVEARRVVMAVPLGTTVPLPDAVHSLRVTRYTEDFRLDRMPVDPATTSGDDTDNTAKAEGTAPIPRQRGGSNPAARLQILREGEPVSESWVFARAPYLFQPPNMRYTFALLGAGASQAKGSEERKQRP